MFDPIMSAGLLAATLALGAALAMAAQPDPMAALSGANRVLLVAAPSATDPDLQRQRAVFAEMGQGARERDLVIVEAVGEGTAAQRLRTRFGLSPDRFTAVLVGKDGGAKLRSATVLGPDRLFPTIDAMPMRQDEMKRPRP